MLAMSTAQAVRTCRSGQAARIAAMQAGSACRSCGAGLVSATATYNTVSVLAEAGARLEDELPLGVPGTICLGLS